MTRTVNAATLKLGKQLEGLRLTAYPDPGSRDGTPWTIGYGHTGPDIRKGSTCTEGQADAWFVRDIATAAAIVENSVTVPLTDNQFGALVLFTMNVGKGSPKKPGFTTSTLLKKLNKGDYASVPAEMARWKLNDGKVMEGLVTRRAAEAGLWASGSFASSAPVTAKPAAPAVIDKETVSWGAGILATLGAVFSGTGPVQWALAAVIVTAFGVGIFFFLRNRVFAK